MRPTQRDTSSGRALRLIDAVAGAGEPLGVRELGRRTGVPRSTVSRLAKLLVDWGGLERTADGRLRPGLRLFELGQRVPRQRGLRDAALPAMQDLLTATGEVVQLAVIDGRETVCVEQLAGRLAPTVPSRVGQRVPAHATAMGKALLAFAPPSQVDALLAEPLVALTPATIVEAAHLRRELAAIRARGGLAWNREESQRGLLGVAAAIRGADGHATGALALAMPRGARTSPRRMAPAVRLAALAIARELSRPG